MALKSTIEIPIDDAKAQKFFAAFAKYQKETAAQPGIIGATTKAAGGLEDKYSDITNQLEYQSRLQEKILNALVDRSKRVEESTKKTAGFWASIRKDASALHAGTIGAIGIGGGEGGGLLGGLAKGVVGKVVAVVAGALGAEAVWNAVKSASVGRRSAQGLGLRYGEQLAFQNVYGRLVDTGSLLGAVSEGRGNIASPQAAALYGLGINPANTSDTAQTSQMVLDKVRQIALQTPESQLGLLLQSRQLGALGFSTEDLRRIRTTSPEEFQQFAKQYETRQKKFDVDDKTLKKMQDFTVTVDAAEKTVQSALIDKLGLAGSAIDDFAHALYVATGQVGGSAAGAGAPAAGGAIGGGAAGAFVPTMNGPHGTQDTHQNRRIFKRQLDWFKDRGLTPPITKYEDWLKSGVGGLALPSRGASAAPTIGGQQVTVTATETNNPMGMTAGGQLARYGTTQEGVQAAYRNLLAYQKKGIDTLHDIIFTWTPPDDHHDPMLRGNDPAAEVRRIMERTGWKENQHLDVRDKAVASQLLSEIARNENVGGRGAQFTAGTVKIMIENNTGGNSIVQASQMGFPR